MHTFLWSLKPAFELLLELRRIQSVRQSPQVFEPQACDIGSIIRWPCFEACYTDNPGASCSPTDTRYIAAYAFRHLRKSL